jgi:hypothetical protein
VARWPFLSERAGIVSSVTRLDVKNAASVVAATEAAGATERDELSIDDEHYTLTVIFDHFGHLWWIMERDKSNGRVAA